VADYEYYYNNARNRYYNACSEINKCENKINNLEAQRRQKINLINRLKVDIKRNQDALDRMIAITKSDGSLNSRVANVSNKTVQASVNFSGMVKSSNVINKSLIDVYSEETAKTKSILNQIFGSFEARKASLEARLMDLKTQLRNAEAALQDIENGITSNKASLQDWTVAKNNAAYDMEYYRRRMYAAV
jgi:chromosome segregation ATPase